MGDSMSDTDRKIITKDHDILVQTYTLVQEMVRRNDETTRSNNEIITGIRMELRAVSDNQIKVNGDFRVLENRLGDCEVDVAKLDTKSLRLDVAAMIGTIFVGLIAWFK